MTLCHACAQLLLGEEMTRYCMELILKEWVNPFIDTSKWEYFDCSCKNRDATDDQVIRLPDTV